MSHEVHADDAVATRLAERYGRSGAPRLPRTRRTLVLSSIGIAVLVAGTAAFTFLTSLGSDLDLQTTSYVVQSDGVVSVRWQVSGAANERLVCTIAAMDNNSSVVGIRALEIPVDASGTAAGTTTVRTVVRASSGLLSSCTRA